MAVQMELTRIIINETSDSHIIFLKEVDGERMFPIVIGMFEATSIDRRVGDQHDPAPLTHDLLASAIDLLGGELAGYLYQRASRAHVFRQAADPARRRDRRGGFAAERRDRPGGDRRRADLRRRRHYRRGQSVNKPEGCQSGRLGRS